MVIDFTKVTNQYNSIIRKEEGSKSNKGNSSFYISAYLFSVLHNKLEIAITYKMISAHRKPP